MLEGKSLKNAYLTQSIDLSKRFIKEVLSSSYKHDITGVAAEGAYRAIITFFPFLMLIVSITSIVGARFHLLGELMKILSSFFLPNTTDIIRSYLETLLLMPSKTIISVSTLALFWFGTMYFITLGKGVARAYNLTPRPFAKDLVIHFFLFIFAGSFLVLFSLLMLLGPVAVNIMNNYFQVPPVIDFLLGKLRYTASIIGIVILLTVIYHVSLPKPSRLGKQIPGAIASSLAWVVTTGSFSLYIQYYNVYEKTYGSLAGMIIFLVWLYITNSIYIMGAEINHALEVIFDKKSPKPEANNKG